MISSVATESENLQPSLFITWSACLHLSPIPGSRVHIHVHPPLCASARQKWRDFRQPNECCEGFYTDLRFYLSVLTHKTSLKPAATHSQVHQQSLSVRPATSANREETPKMPRAS